MVRLLKNTSTCLETNASCRFLVNCDVEEARRVWHGRKTPDKPCIYPCEQNGDGVVCKHVKKIEERRASLWVGLVTENHINKSYFLRKSSLIVLYEL